MKTFLGACAVLCILPFFAFAQPQCPQGYEWSSEFNSCMLSEQAEVVDTLTNPGPFTVDIDTQKSTIDNNAIRIEFEVYGKSEQTVQLKMRIIQVAGPEPFDAFYPGVQLPAISYTRTTAQTDNERVIQKGDYPNQPAGAQFKVEIFDTTGVVHAMALISTKPCPTGQTWSVDLKKCATPTQNGDGDGGGDDGTRPPQDPTFLKNPLKSDLDTIPKIIVAILDNMILPVAVPLVAVMIIWNGFMFVMARGNAKKLEEAKGAMKWTLIGAAVVLGAYLVSTAIQGTINEIKGSGSAYRIEEVRPIHHV